MKKKVSCNRRNFLQIKVLKLLEITVKNIHVRYQDSTTIPNQSFSAGVTCHKLTLTADEDAKEETPGMDDEKEREPSVSGRNRSASELQRERNDNFASLFTHKAIKVEALSVYFNPDDTLWDSQELSNTELIEKFEIIPRENFDVRQLNYILVPISLRFHLHLNAKLNPDQPKDEWLPEIQGDINIDKLALTLSKKQFDSIRTLRDSWAQVQTRIQVLF